MPRGQIVVSRILCGILAGIVGIAAQSVWAKSALQLLQESPKPRFRDGHTLLPLTRWGWTMPLDVRVELAEHWGYALEFGSATTTVVAKQLDDPKSIASQICALTTSNPKKYPLCVLATRPLLDKKFRESLPAEAWCHDAQGKLIEVPRRQLSPEAPDAVFLKAAALAAEPLAKIRQKVPIAMVLNGGEYGLGIMGFGGPAWEKDPKVLRAKGNKDWFRYISERKAHQELLISRAIREAVPARQLYIYYPTSVCPHEGRTTDWWRWTWDYAAMKPVSDLPNISVYYKEFNTGWTGTSDMLTQVLNAVGGDIAHGEPLSYNWLCGGWVQKNLGPEAFSDPEHYMGFLKCYYTAGMIGGVAGYFSFPPGGFGGDLGEQMPSWLQQMVTLAHAQALFSHVEDLIRQGDLLPGPNRHRWVKDRPAYEFPSGDPEVRVLARRHTRRPEWLLTAWAAGGPDREVTVEIPELGTVTLRARACGSVYRATLTAGKPALKWLDKNGMYPTTTQQMAPMSASHKSFDDGRFSWKASAPLVTPNSNAADPAISIKDPTIIRDGDRWHMFATVRLASGKVDIECLNFADWKEADQAARHRLNLHDQYYCAPQVFYFRPQKLWYLIYQIADKNHQPPFGPAYSTTTTLGNPKSWSKPRWLFREGSETRKWLDFWVICDQAKAHLFYTSLDGRMWRAETKLADFPSGWSQPAVALQADIFEASHTYRLKGMDKYLTIVEAQADARRYYKAYLADRLEGPWRGLADSRSTSFAAFSNVVQDKEWTTNISHGELLRTGVDETMEIDPADVRFLFQGASDPEYRSNPYGKIPWRPGILEMAK